MTARLGSEYRYFGKLVLVPFRYFSIDIYRNIDIFDNTTVLYEVLDLNNATLTDLIHRNANHQKRDKWTSIVVFLHLSSTFSITLHIFINTLLLIYGMISLCNFKLKVN